MSKLLAGERGEGSIAGGGRSTAGEVRGSEELACGAGMWREATEVELAWLWEELSSR